MRCNRRQFGAAVGGMLLAGGAIEADAARRHADDRNELAREVGITTSSLSGHVATASAPGKIALADLPRVLREKLDMRVIDLNTSTLGEKSPKELDRLREAAEKAGCVFTNLKMNQRDLNMDSPEESARRRALAEYKRSIEAAARLGCRWARPLPRKERPDMRIHVASYRELADYAAERDVQMLVENYGWMQAEADSVPKLLEAIGRNVAACPDTGNWDSEKLRREGLARAFPRAVTCDFKARRLGPEGEHPLYDLKACFEIGWRAGFRGPWCLEHANPNRKELFRELALLRDMLRGWMREAED